MAKFTPSGLGWHRDLPDPRDYTPEHDEVVKLLHDMTPNGSRPDRVDWSEYCAEVEDQQGLQTSSVHACLALVQYFERRATGQVCEPSRMFVYKVARRLVGWSGDSGLPLREAWKAITRFGMPPEGVWPYDPLKLDAEPDGFTYAAARPLSDAIYVRLDPRGARPETTLETVKRYLAAGLACVFGFPVSTALGEDAEIPYPTIFDSVRGGQAVMAVGYDDHRRVRSDKGALLVANSWGSGWGQEGYGWLPYSYVREELAADFWTLLSPGWLASGEFSRPE